jgi:predicted metal-dependent phosphoesterase TrpH
MFYDLHIHSGLSPCADDDMSPQNIVQMAKLKGLDIISICDHNSLRQQAVMAKVAKEHDLLYLFGLEIQTKEEVHILAYFRNQKDLPRMQSWLTHHQMKVMNRSNFFGHQYLYNSKDEIIDEEKNALIFSIRASLEECIEAIHSNHGLAVLAHIYGRKNGIMHQLGFIPLNLPIDGVEVVHEEEIQRFTQEYPQYENIPCLVNSDAHSLSMIHEAKLVLSPIAQKRFRGK